MFDQLIRVYENLDVKEIHKHLLIYGDLSGSCSHCGKIDLKLDATRCPECSAEFKYISFRNIRSHVPKALKFLAERPAVTLVDYDDYKKALGTMKAKEFLG